MISNSNLLIVVIIMFHKLKKLTWIDISGPGKSALKIQMKSF